MKWKILIILVILLIGIVSYILVSKVIHTNIETNTDNNIINKAITDNPVLESLDIYTYDWCQGIIELMINITDDYI